MGEFHQNPKLEAYDGICWRKKMTTSANNGGSWRMLADTYRYQFVPRISQHTLGDLRIAQGIPTEIV